jgi:hypothetical protein
MSLANISNATQASRAAAHHAAYDAVVEARRSREAGVDQENRETEVEEQSLPQHRHGYISIVGMNPAGTPPWQRPKPKGGKRMRMRGSWRTMIATMLIMSMSRSKRRHNKRERY